METKAQDYRAKANQYAEMARFISDPRAKEELLRIARSWTDMASRAEQRNRDADDNQGDPPVQLAG